MNSVAHGGGVAACATYAACHHQSLAESQKRGSPYHPDPASLTANFLTATIKGPYEVHLKVFSTSKKWTRIDCDVVQRQPEPRQWEKPVLRVRMHISFTELPELALPQVHSPTHLTLLPHSPGPFATRCPLRFHPQDCKETQMFAEFGKKKRVRMAERDDMIEPVGLQWGAWMELTDETEDLTQSAAMIVFFADLFRNGPELVPVEQRAGDSWYATMSFTLDFRAKFPLKPTPLSPTKVGSLGRRTVGLHSTTKFIHEGRHDDTVEVWSAPSIIGDKNAPTPGSDEWKQGSQILAVSTQMALTLPIQVNLRQGKEKPKL